MMAQWRPAASSDSKTVALAAKHYSVPCIVLGAIYKLTLVYLPERDCLVSNVFANTAAVLQCHPVCEEQRYQHDSSHEHCQE